MPITLADLDPDVLAELYQFIDIPLALKATCKATCAAAHKAGHGTTLTKWAELPGLRNDDRSHGLTPMYLWASAMGGCEEERAKKILFCQRECYRMLQELQLWSKVARQGFHKTRVTVIGANGDRMRHKFTDVREVVMRYNDACDELQELYNGCGVWLTKNQGLKLYGIWANYPLAVCPYQLVKRPGHLRFPRKENVDDYPVR